MHTGKDLMYEEYCSLLMSATQQYDIQRNERKDKVVQRQIFEHGLTFDETEEFYDTNPYDIDQQVELIEANVYNFIFSLCLANL